MRKQFRELKHQLPYKFIERNRTSQKAEAEAKAKEKKSPSNFNDTEHTAPSSSSFGNTTSNTGFSIFGYRTSDITPSTLSNTAPNTALSAFGNETWFTFQK